MAIADHLVNVGLVAYAKAGLDAWVACLLMARAEVISRLVVVRLRTALFCEVGRPILAPRQAHGRVNFG